jgi:hypothetical protein
MRELEDKEIGAKREGGKKRREGGRREGEQD